jgi:hypothetical protein
MEQFQISDKRVTYLKDNYVCIAIVEDRLFFNEKCMLEGWWYSKLGVQISDSLYDSGAYELGVFFYDSEKLQHVKENVALNFPKYKLGKIMKILKRRYKDCEDGVLAMTDCNSCNDIIKVGDCISCMKSSVAGMHMCDICLYQ